jgi:hypothetical protein
MQDEFWRFTHGLGERPVTPKPITSEQRDAFLAIKQKATDPALIPNDEMMHRLGEQLTRSEGGAPSAE